MSSAGLEIPDTSTMRWISGVRTPPNAEVTKDMPMRPTPTSTADWKARLVGVRKILQMTKMMMGTVM